MLLHTCSWRRSQRGAGSEIASSEKSEKSSHQSFSLVKGTRIVGFSLQRETAFGTLVSVFSLVNESGKLWFYPKVKLTPLEPLFRKWKTLNGVDCRRLV